MLVFECLDFHRGVIEKPSSVVRRGSLSGLRGFGVFFKFYVPLFMDLESVKRSVYVPQKDLQPVVQRHSYVSQKDCNHNILNMSRIIHAHTLCFPRIVI